ncbi:hypothetical protein Pfo_026645 [Paulownia fortunei]|nr:hypothetical protein Pfo_026645 [Paulownia fortunei]
MSISIMAYFTSINSIIFLFLISPNFVHEIKAFKFLGKHNINIYSDLPKNSSSLILHCASKDDDIGKHILYPGQVFSWHFRNNFFATTLFFCHFWWGSKQKSIVVFKGNWDRDNYYHTYSYSVNSDGIYLSNDPKNHKANLGLIVTWDRV